VFGERGRWVYRESTAGDRQHGSVVHGVSEDCVWSGDADSGEGIDLALICRNVKEFVGDDSIDDFDSGCKDAVGGNVESLQALLNNPIIC